MMNYGKIVDGRMQAAPNALTVNGFKVINPGEETLRSEGYLPIRYTDTPDAPERCVMVARWKEQEGEIVRTWEAKPSIMPLTDTEILRIYMRQRVNAMTIDNQTAGRMIDYFPTRSEFCDEGALIPAKTRVRDDNDATVIWRNNVDLWNTPENSPENAPTLWDKIAYHDGIRIIPDVIPATLAWMNGDLGWRDGHVYKSGMDGNVYLPGTQGVPWEQLT